MYVRIITPYNRESRVCPRWTRQGKPRPSIQVNRGRLPCKSVCPNEARHLFVPAYANAQQGGLSDTLTRAANAHTWQAIWLSRLVLAAGNILEPLSDIIRPWFGMAGVVVLVTEPIPLWLVDASTLNQSLFITRQLVST